VKISCPSDAGTGCMEMSQERIPISLHRTRRRRSSLRTLWG
jgi:hypothetical protein